MKRSATRMITPDQTVQIGQMGSHHFGDIEEFALWFCGTFQVPYVKPNTGEDVLRLIRRIGTAQRASEVIAVLRKRLLRVPLRLCEHGGPG